MIKNTHVKNHRLLGLTLPVYRAVVIAVENYLEQHDDLVIVSEDELRKIDPILQNQRVWNIIKEELNLA